MTSGAGVSRTIWRDFRFPGQPEVLLEFIHIKSILFVFIMCTSVLESNK